MDEEKTQFSFGDQRERSANTFKQMWDSLEFTDVTLVTGDNQQIKAHKFLLSTYSNLFKKILVRNPHPNPLIYLKDVKHKDLVKVLNFLYCGHCSVGAADLSDFLRTGTDLEIIGLIDLSSTGNLKLKNEGHGNGCESIVDDGKLSSFQNRNENFATNSLEHLSKDLMERDPEIIRSETAATHTVSHRDCNQCGLRVNNPKVPKSHKQRKHGHLKHPNHVGPQNIGEESVSKTTTRGRNNKQQKLKPNKSGYECDQCDFSANKEIVVTRHRQTAHNSL
jgi:hypothetical protein